MRAPLLMASLLALVPLLSTVSAATEMPRTEKSATEKPKGAITEITVQRVSGTAPGSADRTVFRSDGTALYTGSRRVERMGEFRAELPAEDWNRLVELLKSHEFWTLRERYRQGEEQVPPRLVLDVPGVIVTAVRDGERKSVTMYGIAGPTGLRQIQSILLDAGRKLKWVPAKKNGEQ